MPLADIIITGPPVMATTAPPVVVQPPPPVYVGSHEDKLSHVRPMHIDPDDDQPTREDKEAEKAARRPPPGAMG